jgi:rhodanese-related sulfurtransferase
MPENVNRHEVQRVLVEAGQVVEVLPAEEYAKRHLAGAVNIPLAELAARAPAELDPSRPVIVYCHDYL